MFFSPIKFSRLLSRNADADADDVLLAKSMMRDFDISGPDQSINEWPDDALFQNIGTFQKQLSLPVNEEIPPDGLTHAAINARYLGSVGNTLAHARRGHLQRCAAAHRPEPAMILIDPNLLFRNWDDKKGCWVDDKCD